MKSRRLVHVYPFYHKKGGVERYLWELSHAQITGPTAHVSIASMTAETPQDRRIKILPLPKIYLSARILTPIFSLLSYFKLIRAPFDLIHAQGASTLKQDVVTAHSCHKAWFFSSLKATPFASQKWWLKILNPMHYFTILVESIQYRRGNYKKVVAVSKSVKTDLIRHYRIPENHIEVIYSGVNAEEFRPEKIMRYRPFLRQKYRIQDDEILAVFASNEFQRKGLRTVLQAFALLKHPKLKLLVVGKDNPAPYLEEAQILGVAPQIIFFGLARDMSAVYAASDLLIFPTTYEPFGLVITEAMAAGLPVITSRLAGAAELMEDGKSGLLLDDPTNAQELADKMRILLSADARQKIGEAGRVAAVTQSWQEVAQQYDKVYDAVLAESN